jgi:hypothetical protein
MNHSLNRLNLPLGALLMGLAVSAAGAPPSTPQAYTIQVVARPGDSLDGVRVKAGGRLEIGGLNDRGELVLLLDNAAGGSALVRYADDRFTSMVVGGGDGPGGRWPQDVHIDAPVRMNRLGNVVFTADVPEGGKASGGLYLWDDQAQKVTAVGLREMPAGSAGTFLGFRSAAINNQNEIAFVGGVANEVGWEQSGLYLLGRDGKLLSLAPPGQKLPFSEAGELLVPSYSGISLNDAGVVTFSADFEQVGGNAYVWEKGTITSLFPDIHRSLSGVVFGRAVAWVNNQNRAVLAATTGDPVHGVSVVRGLYRWADGVRTPLVVAGQVMPDGARLADFGGFHISAANEAGQHVVVATLRDGTTAAYLLAADGKPTLILQTGMTTGLGPITRIGRLGGGGSPLNRLVLYGFTYDLNLIPGSGGSVALNDQGQVALTVQIDGGPDTVVLLTPIKG